MLAPLMIRELVYRILQSQYGHVLYPFAIGYESPSQFSREYARLYGKPPMQNIQDMRNMLAEANVLME